MEERIFSHENGRFRNWWYADLYDGLIVFYSPFRDGEKGAAPVKAWGDTARSGGARHINPNETSLRQSLSYRATDYFAWRHTILAML